MKRCLLLILGLPFAALANDAFETLEPDAIEWQQSSQFGASTVNLVGAPDQEGLYIQRIKFPPGTMSRPHFHDKVRYATVIEGTWYIGFTREYQPENTTPVPAGSFMVHPAGEIHYDGARDEEVIVEIRGFGPVSTTRVDQ